MLGLRAKHTGAGKNMGGVWAEPMVSAPSTPQGQHQAGAAALRSPGWARQNEPAAPGSNSTPHPPHMAFALFLVQEVKVLKRPHLDLLSLLDFASIVSPLMGH